MNTTTRRQSRYVSAVRQALEYFGHATNAEITDDLRRSYPHLSDTTVHRITQRLLEDGEIQLATHDEFGAMVFDINTAPHDHFECSECGGLNDISVPQSARRDIRAVIGVCRLNGPLKIVGECHKCIQQGGIDDD